jgi:hypothetical protein
MAVSLELHNAGVQPDVSISIFLRQQNRGQDAVRFRDDPDFGSTVKGECR